MQALTDSEDESRETGGEKAQVGQRERNGNTNSDKRTFSGGKAAKKTLKVRVFSCDSCSRLKFHGRQLLTKSLPSQRKATEQKEENTNQPGPDKKKRSKEEVGEEEVCVRGYTPTAPATFSHLVQCNHSLSVQGSDSQPEIVEGLSGESDRLYAGLSGFRKSYQCNVKPHPQEMRWMKQTLWREVGLPDVVGRRAQDCRLRDTSRRHRIQMRTVGESSA